MSNQPGAVNHVNGLKRLLRRWQMNNPSAGRNDQGGVPKQPLVSCWRQKFRLHHFGGVLLSMILRKKVGWIEKIPSDT